VVLSGSLDGSVKVWTLTQPSSSATSPSFSSSSSTSSSSTSSSSVYVASPTHSNSNSKTSSTPCVTLAPVCEFSDHEHAVTCVALDCSGALAASGAEDGTLIVWNVVTRAVMVNYTISSSSAGKASESDNRSKASQSKAPGKSGRECSGRGVTCVQWLPPDGPAEACYGASGGFERDKLVCATMDCKLLCLDR
jgi:WD40 repeat protein